MPENRNYYGLAATNVQQILSLDDYQLNFTPFLDFNPKNYFHCDVYDNSNLQPKPGVAASAEMNLRTEEFKKIWIAFHDKEMKLQKSDITCG